MSISPHWLSENHILHHLHTEAVVELTDDFAFAGQQLKSKGGVGDLHFQYTILDVLALSVLCNQWLHYLSPQRQ